MNPKLRAIAVGGSIAGALDILFAISFAAYGGRTPVWLLQTVATGLLGKDAYSGGWGAAAQPPVYAASPRSPVATVCSSHSGGRPP